MAKIQKQNVRVLISLGRHASASDAGSVITNIRDFGPHVFVQESSTGFSGTRKNRIQEFNRAFEKARVMDTAELDRIHRLADTIDTPYKTAVARAIIEERGLSFYIAESYSQAELTQMEAVTTNFDNNLETILGHLARGNTSQALLLLEEGLRPFVQLQVVKRNVRMADGFERMLTDLPDLVKRRWWEINPVNILGRVGLGHILLVQELQARGFDVSQSQGSDLDFRLLLELKLTQTPQMRIDESDLIRTLFRELYYQIYAMGWTSAQDEVLDISAKFVAMGSEAGFLDFVSTNRRLSQTAQAFMNRLRRVLEET
ncbi:hypothetical protein HY988_06175 [Candidatus Micrarchaeota archaeon]|nr:hypothetical protein [Candidatus Micrarchaeota archaeon]